MDICSYYAIIEVRICELVKKFSESMTPAHEQLG